MGILFELERMERLVNDVKGLYYVDNVKVTNYKMYKGEKQDGATCDTSDWIDYRIDTPWSDLNSHRWFRTTITIPNNMEGKHVEFIITTGREGEWDATNPQMLFYLDGEIVQGIDVNHRSVTISECAEAGEQHDIAMYAFSGSVKGDLILHTELVVVDDVVEQYYYDLAVPVETARLLKKHDEDNCRRILMKLNDAVNILDLRKKYSEKFYKSLKESSAIIKKEFYTEINKDAPVVNAIGHTHIDIAWLWTVAQTREKVLRSFSTVLNLMDKYPEYKFMSSQPILYQFVKEQEPEMYKKIKERIDEGRWEVDGAMWLEADCNLPCGESLVRQIVKGHKFIKDEFGKESKSLWLPDVFGYSAAIPQILKKTGIPYFVTTKIAWNQYNQLPNDTFMWKGIDGSEIFVYMPTACDFDRTLGLNIAFTDTRNTTTYTGIINPNMTLGTYKRFQNKDLTENTLMLFGYGDGGGGPTKEMLENARRLRYGLPGLPRIEHEFEQDFLDRTHEEIVKKSEIPTWNGELYFEYHRGTYTSIAKNKRYNRKSEVLYEQLESLGTLAESFGIKYPAEVIKNGWDIILLNQFHDIIPGSAIKEVYDQTDKEYELILKDGENALKEISKEITKSIKTKNNSFVVFNTTGYSRNDLITVKDIKNINVKQVIDDEGNYYDIQFVDDNEFIFYALDIPAMGYKVFYMVLGESPEEVISTWDGSFENEYYKAMFNDNMELTALYDKKSRKEFIKGNRVGNEICAYEDRPMNWDNWDIDIFYQKKKYEADYISTPELIEAGPIRRIVRNRYKFVDSIIVQDVYLYRDIPRIDFKHHVEWKEHNTLLRVNFPVEVNTTKATYEIQYGNIERETTMNNSWDTAKFETCGHKWVDLSENGLGISLMNDCKYGHSVKNGEMGLTLIKAGTYPHEDADIGEHEYTYSIYPHEGRWYDAKTVEMAYNLNVPTWVILKEDSNKNLDGDINLDLEETVDCEKKYSFISCDKKNCFLEVMKKAEDGNGYILRMYENENRMTKATIRLGFKQIQVFECDLLENNLKEVSCDNSEFTDLFNPYEIKTYRIIF